MPDTTSSYHDIMRKARLAEDNSEKEKAEKLYRQAIKKEPHLEQAYQRLMILLRKQKKYEEELSLITKAIHQFEEFYKQRSEKLLGKHSQATRISNALAKSLGQNGKKTEAIFYPQPIPKWIQRQSVVEKKLGK